MTMSNMSDQMSTMITNNDPDKVFVYIISRLIRNIIHIYDGKISPVLKQLGSGLDWEYLFK